jgi:hypothetical protein
MVKIRNEAVLDQRMASRPEKGKAYGCYVWIQGHDQG